MENVRKLSGPVALFRGALVFYRRHFQTILTLLALPVFLRVILEALRYEGLHASILLVTIAVVVVNILAQAALIFLVADSGRGTAGTYLKKAWQIFWPFLWVTVLTGIISFLAFLALVIPGIIVAVFLIFSSFLVVVEDRRGMEALRASWRYVRGHWWAIFGRFLFLIVVLIASLIIISLIASLFASSDSVIARNIISAIVSGLILSPVGAVYLFDLYRELKNES